MDVSIVMPIYKADPSLLRKIDSSIKKQRFKGKLEVVKVDLGLGLAESMNHGIRKAKYGTIVTLHQDCVPSSNRWLDELTAPLNKKEVVASVSDVLLPKELWESFDWTAKILSSKEQQLITPLMDEKGCAYRKDALKKAGLFDSKNYRTAGEDFDMYIKLSRIGKIAYPHCKVIHWHRYAAKSRIRKELQLANAFGALVRIHGKSMPRWHVGLAKAIPLLGYPLFLARMNYKRIGALSIIGALLMIPVSLIYSYGFWKGFLMGRQTV